MPSSKRNQRNKSKHKQSKLNKNSNNSNSSKSNSTTSKSINNDSESLSSFLTSIICGCIELLFSIIGIIIIAIFYETVWNHSPSAPLLSMQSDIKETTKIPDIYKVYANNDDDDNKLETYLWKDIDGTTNLEKMLVIGRSRKPMIIKKSPSTYWKANREWKLSKSPSETIEYLTKLHYENNRNTSDVETESISYDINNDIISVYRMNNSNFFTFMDKTRSFVDYEMVSDSSLDKNIENINVSFTEFLKYINNKKYSKLNVNNSYLYYINSAKNVYQDLKPISWFKMTDKTVEFTNKHKRQLLDINTIYLEISPFKLFINAHYEMTHNFYYQIDGKRRFLISPPSESSKLHSFPEGHPSFRSSQIYPYKFYFIPFNLWKTRKSHPFPPAKKTSRVNAWSVELSPGDLLYIPPFYWTQITSLENSIAIKSSSLGFEQVFSSLSDPSVLPKVLQYPSLDDVDKQKWLLHQLAFFTRQLIDRILKSLPDKRDLINSEKDEILNEINDELEWDVVHKWMNVQLIDNRYSGNLLWEDMQCEYFDPSRCPLHGNTTNGLMKTMEQNAKTWAFAYKQMENYVDNKDDIYWIRNLMLATHIEQFVSFITGHDNYCYFIQCLINDRFGSLYVESEQEERRRQTEERMREQGM